MCICKLHWWLRDEKHIFWLCFGNVYIAWFNNLSQLWQGIFVRRRGPVKVLCIAKFINMYMYLGLFCHICVSKNKLMHIEYGLDISFHIWWLKSHFTKHYITYLITITVEVFVIDDIFKASDDPRSRSYNWIWEPLIIVWRSWRIPSTSCFYLLKQSFITNSCLPNGWNWAK